MSDHPQGPYRLDSDRPLFDFGYAAIDAHVHLGEDGRNWLYFVRDCSENIVDGVHESHLYGVEVAGDLRTLLGDPVLLLRPEQEWEFRSGPSWRWNEGPFVIRQGETYVLLYSANHYADRTYAIGAALSTSPLGPYTKIGRNPILESAPKGSPQADLLVSGPGHCSVVASPDGTERLVVYHVHRDPVSGGSSREAWMDRLHFEENGEPSISGPTLLPQPVPSGSRRPIDLPVQSGRSTP